jgi:hypothetical protein
VFPKNDFLKTAVLVGHESLLGFIEGGAGVLGPGAAGFGNGGKGAGGSGSVGWSGGGVLGISGPLTFTVKEFEPAGRHGRTAFLGFL